MRFLIERMELTDASGVPQWTATLPPRKVCEVHEKDALAALSSVVEEDGGIRLGVTASFANGQAVTVARNGNRVYALRAIPEVVIPW